MLRVLPTLTLTALTAALWLGTASPAAAGDDRMTGAWALNFDQSENMGARRWTINMDVEFDGDDVVIKRNGSVEENPKPLADGWTYVTNGEKHEITDAFDNTRNVSAKWAGKKLKITWDGDSDRGGPFRGVETWKIKKGQLYIKTQLRGEAGWGFAMKQYYDRRE